MMIETVEILFPLPLPGPLTYRVPEGFPVLRPGDCVLAPVGKRLCSGYVVRTGLREWGGGNEPQVGTQAAVQAETTIQTAAQAECPALKYLEAAQGEYEVLDAARLALVRDLARYYLCPEGTVLALFALPKVAPWVSVTRFFATERAREAEASGTLEALTRRSPAQRTLVKACLEAPAGLLSTELAALGLSSGVAKACEAKSLVGMEQEVLAYKPLPTLPPSASLPTATLSPSLPTSTPFPASAHLSASETLEAHPSLPNMGAEAGPEDARPRLWVSSLRERPEVYVHLFRHALEAGEQVAFFVAHEALRNFYLPALQAAFGPRLRVEGRGTGAWAQTRAMLRDGEAVVVMGSKEALTAPYRTLGLVVVDSEGEPRHKRQDPAPRLHYRDAALFLARRHPRAKVLLTDQVPSFETQYNLKLGKFALWEVGGGQNTTLTESALPASFPKVRVVETHKVSGYNAVEGGLSAPLLLAADRVRAAGGEVWHLDPAAGFTADKHTLALTSAPDDEEMRRVQADGALALASAPASPALLLVSGMDAFLARGGFRASEQLVRQLRPYLLAGVPLVAQTEKAGDPVFEALRRGFPPAYRRALLAERRDFAYPPFARLLRLIFRSRSTVALDKAVETFVRDFPLRDLPLSGPSRTWAGASSFAYLTATLLVHLPQGPGLAKQKDRLYAYLLSFEKSAKSVNVVVDVDPL